jgi:hypothetical protein
VLACRFAFDCSLSRSKDVSLHENHEDEVLVSECLSPLVLDPVLVQLIKQLIDLLLGHLRFAPYRSNTFVEEPLNAAATSFGFIRNVFLLLL